MKRPIFKTHKIVFNKLTPSPSNYKFSTSSFSFNIDRKKIAYIEQIVDVAKLSKAQFDYNPKNFDYDGAVDKIFDYIDPLTNEDMMQSLLISYEFKNYLLGESTEAMFNDFIHKILT